MKVEKVELGKTLIVSLKNIKHNSRLWSSMANVFIRQRITDGSYIVTTYIVSVPFTYKKRAKNINDIYVFEKSCAVDITTNSHWKVFNSIDDSLGYIEEKLYNYGEVLVEEINGKDLNMSSFEEMQVKTTNDFYSDYSIYKIQTNDFSELNMADIIYAKNSPIVYLKNIREDIALNTVRAIINSSDIVDNCRNGYSRDNVSLSPSTLFKDNDNDKLKL